MREERQVDRDVLTTSESEAVAAQPVAPHFSVAGGWLLCLTCLTLVVVARQLWQFFSLDSTPPPPSARFVVDVNRAEMHELQALPEVGPSLSTKIIEYRQQQGGFNTLDDLLEVPGVGPRTLEQLRPMLTTGRQPTEQPEARLESRADARLADP
jgi:competence ComEA-like helix-hairpin-helix protein